jgi:uncharacterized membrane protein YfcA
MWDHYKRTFVGMQLVISIVTALVFLVSHYWVHAIVFFVVMQLGSVAGAVWGKRLKRKLEPYRLQTSPLRK